MSDRSVIEPLSEVRLDVLVRRIEQLSTGELAELRRMGTGGIPGPVFWRLYVPLSDGMQESGRRERQWQVILQALATLHGLFLPSRPLGTALSMAQFSDARLLRLLHAHDERLADEVRLLAHFLSTKAVAVNVSELASLVLSDGLPHEESVRSRIARRFYQTQEMATKEA